MYALVLLSRGASRPWPVWCWAFAGLLGACGGGGGDGGGGTGPAAASLQIVARSDTEQAAARTGHPVAKPPSIRVRRGSAGVAGIPVTFTVVLGEGTLEGASATTDANGVATLGSWKPGRIGRNSLTASASGASGGPVTFIAWADPGPLMMARYSFADSVNMATASAPQWVPARIRGDGRSRDGQPAAAGTLGEYQGGFCGVQGLIGRGPEYGEHDAFRSNTNLDWNDALPPSCKPFRAIRFYPEGLDKAPRLLGTLIQTDPLRTMAAGESRNITIVFQTGGEQPGAIGGLTFRDGTAFATRLPDGRDELDRPVHRWRVESRGTHRTTAGSGEIFMPFALTITEVPFPYPTFP